MLLNIHHLENNLDQVNLKVYRVDEQMRKPNWKINKVDRPYTVFWYVESGEKTVYINHVKYEVQAGHLVVFPSQIPFEIVETRSSVSMHHIEMAIELMIGPFDLTRFYKFPILTTIKDTDSFGTINNLWQEIMVNFKNNQSSSVVENHSVLSLGLEHTIQLLHFKSLMMNWFIEILNILKPNIMELNPTLDSRIHHLFHYINDHLSEKITLKTLADEVFLSQSHLSLLFRENLNMSPMEFVRNMKIQRARKLLLTTHLSLKEIADLIGFDDQSQLSRAFQQKVGVSPSKYRQNGDFI